MGGVDFRRCSWLLPLVADMNRILLILACFFAILSGVLIGVYKYQSKRIDTLETAKTTLQANNQLLISKMKRAYDDKVELGRKIEELKKVASADADFDWSADIRNTFVVRWLHENADKVRGTRARAD